jgi:hypothetical protein
MTVRHASAVLVLATLAGCSHPPAPLPPAPSGVRRLAVEKPVNRTQDDLIVYGPGILQRILKDDIVTVPDLLAEDLQKVLTRQGFRVAAPGTEDVPVLRTEIGRWEHYAASYNTVTVDVVASLVDPASGRELWRAARSGWVVPTYDAESRRDACLEASTAVAEALLEGWEPGAAPAR